MSRVVSSVTRGIQDDEYSRPLNEKQLKQQRSQRWWRMVSLTIIEFVLCIICMVLGYYHYHTIEEFRNTQHIRHKHGTVRFILEPPTPMAIAGTFLSLTYIDLLSWHMMRPITYYSWILVAAAGFLLFLLYAGCIILSVNSLISIISIIFGIITALVFLADLICMLLSLKRFPSPYWIMKRTPLKSDQCVCANLIVERPICSCHDDLGLPCSCNPNASCDCSKITMYRRGDDSFHSGGSTSGYTTCDSKSNHVLNKAKEWKIQRLTHRMHVPTIRPYSRPKSLERSGVYEQSNERSQCMKNCADGDRPINVKKLHVYKANKSHVQELSSIRGYSSDPETSPSNYDLLGQTSSIDDTDQHPRKIYWSSSRRRNSKIVHQCYCDPNQKVVRNVSTTVRPSKKYLSETVNQHLPLKE